jgi:plasmid stability protein
MTLTVHLPNDLERRLRERATRDGRSVEDYVLKLIERDAVRPGRGPVVDALSVQPNPDQTLSDAEFELLLDGLTSGPELPHLPADFSRAGIYADHD